MNNLRSTIETRFVKGSAIALMSGVALVGCGVSEDISLMQDMHAFDATFVSNNAAGEGCLTGSEFDRDIHFQEIQSGYDEEQNLKITQINTDRTLLLKFSDGTLIGADEATKQYLQRKGCNTYRR